jgi:short-subunit dehydrogenase
MNVVITGASRGMGKAIAMKFAKDAHTLFLCARTKETLEKTAAEIKTTFPSSTIHTFVADLSVKEEVTAFGKFCLQHGSPDIVINNAGYYLPGNCIDEAEGTLDSMLQTNLYSAYYLTRVLVPEMIKRKSGHIFNICSIASLKAYKGGGGYSISKFALNGFSQNLRQELLPYGIKVTAVFPGAVMTDTWGDFDNSSNRIMEVSDIADMVYAATKLSKAAVVEEIVLRPQLGDL